MDGGWDHHNNIPVLLRKKMDEVDMPIAALLRDLKNRGMLEDTLVIFCGEFGRTSYCEGPLSFATYGRDHQQLCGSLLLAGGGFRRGFAYGETDDWGWDVVKDPVHVHDLQATVLHALGLDHLKLVTRYQGRDFRLTDVAGNVIKPLLA
jgi:arylsulfatase A-like enzyme